MPRNASGTYSLPAGTPFVTGTVISSTVANSVNNDISTALTQSIASTGVTTPSANLPMGTFRHTGVGNATAQACYASVTDVQNGSLVSLSGVSGTDTITATAPFTVAAYAGGQEFRFVAAGANLTNSVTINISGLGAKSITKAGAVALNPGDISSAAVCDIVYDGTQFQLIGARQGASVGALVVNARSANTIFGSGDLGSMNQFTSTFTQTFTAAGTLGAGWYIDVQNIGVGVITFDANGAETFNTPAGALATVNLYPGEGYRIVCNGTSFDMVGRQSVVQLGAATVLSAVVGATTFETGFTDTEFCRITMDYVEASVSVTSLGFQVKKTGSYLNTGYSTGISYDNGATASSLTAQTAAYLEGGNTAGNKISGTLEISSPWQTSGLQMLTVTACQPQLTSPKGNGVRIGNAQSSAAAITGIQVLDIGGGAVSGRFVLRGHRG